MPFAVPKLKQNTINPILNIIKKTILFTHFQTKKIQYKNRTCNQPPLTAYGFSGVTKAPATVGGKMVTARGP